MDTPAQIRSRVRTLRRALSSAERQQAAQHLATRVASLSLFAEAQHIAGYLAFDGEMDPAPLLEYAMAAGKIIYLPVLMGEAPMQFGAYRPGDELKPNRFGIPEPQLPKAELRASQDLDLVLTPLVAFDINGTRMGMGGGFYDRSFAFLKNPTHQPRPHLLGLAYELQKFPGLVRQPWDIPLDGIVTEAALYPGGDAHRAEAAP